LIKGKRIEIMLLLQAVLIGFAVGICGTLAGGGLICFSRGSMPQQGWLLGLSGGIMAAVVLLDLWPEALRQGSIWITVTGSALGAALIMKAEILLELLPWSRRQRLGKGIKLGLLLGVGIGAHNLPEGIAIGASWAVGRRVQEWFGLAVLMAVHNIPEGMVIASAMRLEKVSFAKIWALLLLVELPMAFGSGLGAFLGRISGEMVALALGFAGGAMLFLVGRELLPLAKKLAGMVAVGSGFGLGFLIGMLLIAVSR
jgi:ZIP family zinc transporter